VVSTSAINELAVVAKICDSVLMWRHGGQTDVCSLA
jgi:hypothetical protein